MPLTTYTASGWSLAYHLCVAELPAVPALLRGSNEGLHLTGKPIYLDSGWMLLGRKVGDKNFGWGGFSVFQLIHPLNTHYSVILKLGFDLVIGKTYAMD